MATSIKAHAARHSGPRANICAMAPASRARARFMACRVTAKSLAEPAAGLAGVDRLRCPVAGRFPRSFGQLHGPAREGLVHRSRRPLRGRDRAGTRRCRRHCLDVRQGLGRSPRASAQAARYQRACCAGDSYVLRSPASISTRPASPHPIGGLVPLPHHAAEHRRDLARGARWVQRCGHRARRARCRRATCHRLLRTRCARLVMHANTQRHVRV